MRSSDSSLDAFVDDLGTPDPDAMPADKTNIVMNPLEMIEQLNQQVARNSGKFVSSGSHGGVDPLPAPPTGPRAVVNAPGSGKFPDLPNMPTQMANEGKPELAPTAIGKNLDQGIAHQRTMAEMPVEVARS